MNKLEEYQLNLKDRASNKLGINFKTYEVENEFYMTHDEEWSIIEELYDYIGHLEEKIEDMEYEMKENYQPKHVNQYNFYGVSRSDFHD